MGNNEIKIKNQKSQKFFSGLTGDNCTPTPTPNDDDLNEKVVLRISLSNIQKDSKYNIQLFDTEGGMNAPLNQSETLEKDENGNAVLRTNILIQYYFEREQTLSITIIISKEGSTPDAYNIQTTLGCIIGSRENTFIKPISEGKGENLIIVAEKFQEYEDLFELILDIKPNDYMNWQESKNKIFFKLNSGTNLLYQSECIDDFGLFRKIKIPARLLKNGISLIFYDCKKKKVSNITTNIQELINHKIFTIQMNKERTLTVTSNSRITKNYTFVDYLKAGVQIGFSIAIDFTASNGAISNPNSLHYIGSGEPNKYEKAIYACGNIVSYYDYEQMIPCYGFGAKMRNGQVLPPF